MIFTGRLPQGQEFMCVFWSRTRITILVPLQLILTTTAYTAIELSTLSEHDRAALTADWRWDRLNPMPSPARSRLHDSGGFMEDMEALREQNLNGSSRPPDWFKSLRLGMESARELPRRFGEHTPERAVAAMNALLDTIATFHDADALPSEVLAINVPDRGTTVAEVTWDPCLNTALIGHTMMLQLCPSPPVYTIRQSSSLWEVHTDGSVTRWRSPGLVTIMVEGRPQTVKLVEDRHELQEMPTIDMSVPTATVLQLREHERRRDPRDLTRWFFGAPLNDDTFHHQHSFPPSLDAPTRSYDDW